MRPDVVVVGAGVIGLSTAVRLAESGVTVTVVAQHPPARTTSAVAGAMLGISGTGPDDPSTRWTARATPEFERLADDPDSGVHHVHGRAVTTFTDRTPPWAHALHDFRPCTAAELDGFTGGMSVTLPFADMPRYLEHLDTRLRRAGGRLELRRVETLLDLAGAAAVLVDASGTGARELADDPSVTPVRGVHVVLDNPGVHEFRMEAVPGPEWTSIFPHGDRLVVGGVALPEDVTTDSADVARTLLARAVAVEPRLADAAVRGHEVGWRPVRPTPRLDTDHVDATPCVHAYGHGGVGVAVSWGVADDVCGAVRALLNDRPPATAPARPTGTALS